MKDDLIKMPRQLFGPGWGALTAHELWKLKLLWHTLGLPIEMRWPGVIWTEGFRENARQDEMRKDPAFAHKVAKSVGQHPFCEALDFDAPIERLMKIYEWAYGILPYWQLVIYFVFPPRESGLGESMHISMVSEFEQIKRKAIYQVGFRDVEIDKVTRHVWYNYRGAFDHLPRAV